jgi:hypothetical protein
MHCEESVSDILPKIELETKIVSNKRAEFLILDHYIGQEVQIPGSFAIKNLPHDNVCVLLKPYYDEPCYK